MKRVIWIIAIVVATAAIGAGTTKVGGSAKTKVGGSATTKVSGISAQSPPVFVTSVGASSISSASSVTTPAITPTGANRLLIVSVSEYGQSANATSVTFNGSESFTLLSGSDGHFYDSGGRVQTWYLVNPTNTSATVVVTFPGSTSQQAVTACAFSGVNQSVPFGTVASDIVDTSRSTTSTTPTTAATDLAYFAGFCVTGVTFVADSPLTTRQNNGTATGTQCIAATGTAGSPTTTGSFTRNSNEQGTVSIGVAIKPN